MINTAFFSIGKFHFYFSYFLWSVLKSKPQQPLDALGSLHFYKTKIFPLFSWYSQYQTQFLQD